jgi:hypothetical protein
MGKRIWKKGKKRQEALERSFERMLRDGKRMPPNKFSVALKSYFENKTPIDKTRIQWRYNKIEERFVANRQRFGREGLHLMKQSAAIAKGLKIYLNQGPKQLNSMTPPELKRMKNGIELIMHDHQQLINKLGYAIRTAPKEFSPALKQERNKLRKLGLEAKEIIATINKRIAAFEGTK